MSEPEDCDVDPVTVAHVMQSSPAVSAPPRAGLDVVGLFSGVGGLELGLKRVGHRLLGAAEIWEPARSVLQARFPTTPLCADVAQIVDLPSHDVLVAGFPCTDISQAGLMGGIFGAQSGLVRHVFRLVELARPTWVVLENVPNLLRLHKGAAMTYITRCLEEAGYRWAYRVVDTRFTGLPQRRRRVIILASNSESPQDVLLAEPASDRTPDSEEPPPRAYGFYWTEGRGGLGWAVEAVPTIKGGSTIGINSAPAVWMPFAEAGRKLILPSIEDGERLQGFDAGWTEPALTGGRDHRWKLVGNAVTVDVAEWLGRRLSETPSGPVRGEVVRRPVEKWPNAAFGHAGTTWQVHASEYPVRVEPQLLSEFLAADDAAPLSHRAALGFLRRLDESKLSLRAAFVRDVEQHVRATRDPLSRRRVRGTGAGQEQSWASSPEARRRMQANRGRDTKPELALRRALHARGLRYRIQTRAESDLKARLDVVHRPTKTAIDVRGCFWHACPEHGTEPKSNGEYWKRKLARNVERDRQIEQLLAASGWWLEVVWEHEPIDEAADRIMAIVDARRTRSQPATSRT